MSKLKKTVWLFVLILATTVTQASKTVEANSQEVSENLNLEAVASIFGEAKDLESFEKMLNDPKLQISNLDLNGDGYVDYLRVVETYEGSLHVVVIQAVLAKDTYQDVATIEANKSEEGKEIVQVVGDPYLYGPDFIIEPVYAYDPPIFLFFWAHAVYHAYFSPYYWGYYPPYFHHWHPRPGHWYQQHIHNHINSHHLYQRTHTRKMPQAKQLHQKVRKNDYALKHPLKPSETLSTKPLSTSETKPVVKPSAKPILQKEIKPAAKPRPISRPAVKPTAKPAAKPRPVSRPSVKPTVRPSIQPRPVSMPKPMVRPRPMPRPMSMPRPMPRPAVRPAARMH